MHHAVLNADIQTRGSSCQRLGNVRVASDAGTPGPGPMDAPTPAFPRIVERPVSGSRANRMIRCVCNQELALVEQDARRSIQLAGSRPEHPTFITGDGAHCMASRSMARTVSLNSVVYSVL